MAQDLRRMNTTLTQLRVNTSKSFDPMTVSRESLSDLPVEFLGFSLKVLDMGVELRVGMHDSPILQIAAVLRTLTGIELGMLLFNYDSNVFIHLWLLRGFALLSGNHKRSNRMHRRSKRRSCRLRLHLPVLAVLCYYVGLDSLLSLGFSW